jgi:hypothetical protein
MNDLIVLQNLLTNAETALANNLIQQGTLNEALATIDAAGTGDVASKSKSGEAGATSFSFATLTAQLQALVEEGFKLLETIRVLKTLCAESGPGIIMARNHY